MVRDRHHQPPAPPMCSRLIRRRLALALDCSHGEKLVKLYVYSMIVAFR
jgi:hypothetical protein